MKSKQAKAASQLLGLLAADVVGELVTDTGDADLRRLYSKLMAMCVQVRDSAPAMEV